MRRSEVTMARNDPPNEMRRVTRCVPERDIRNPIVVATRNCPSSICLQSKEMALPVTSPSSGHGLDSRMPASCVGCVMCDVCDVWVA